MGFNSGFKGCSVITQFAKLAPGEQLGRRCTQKIMALQKSLKFSPEKSQILSCDTAVANRRYIPNVAVTL